MESHQEEISSADNESVKVQNKKSSAQKNSNASEGEKLNWIEKHRFSYDENKSVEENISAAEKIAQEYLDKFGITATINTPERIALRRKIIEDLYGNGALLIVDSDNLDVDALDEIEYESAYKQSHIVRFISFDTSFKRRNI